MGRRTTRNQADAARQKKKASKTEQRKLSRHQASALLYLATTIVLSLIVGSVLQGLEILPQYIASVAVSVGGIIVFISGLLGSFLGFLFRRTLPKEMWENAN